MTTPRVLVIEAALMLPKDWQKCQMSLANGLPFSCGKVRTSKEKITAAFATFSFFIFLVFKSVVKQVNPSLQI